MATCGFPVISDPLDRNDLLVFETHVRQMVYGMIFMWVNIISFDVLIKVRWYTECYVRYCTRLSGRLMAIQHTI